MEQSGFNHLAISDTWKRWKDDEDPLARNELIEHYLHLVNYTTRRMKIGLPNHISTDDLSSYGTMGLMDAIDKFEIQRGLKFETYANWRIRGAIIDGLRQNDWVPRSIREKAKKLEDAYQELEQQYLRSVTDEEMCEFLDVSDSEFQQMIQEVSVTTICSIEDQLKDDDTETRMTFMIDEQAIDPDDTVHNMYIKQSLAKAIDRLTNKERIVVSLYYYEDLSLSEIAQVMSLTPSRISQLHSKAILRLRGSLSRSKKQLLEK